ncbi:MAG: D-glycero-beta-D-manno-heptose 1,7-bisphosphate 7-phosphatase [Paucibacter sp.]|nr:D-glycero-beta-D-manno-heptose 1,7-bisphosphate 7-phosphatase [Roseateles sp.]
MTRPAAFLDRDGVINLDHGYVYRWEDFVFVPGAIDAMRRLQAAGYALVVVTNQSGIARGIYTEDDFLALDRRMREHLEQEGVEVSRVEYCPHLEGAKVSRYDLQCDCRKPAPGMILRAAQALDIDLVRSVLFGDKPSDIDAAGRAGVGRAVLLAADGHRAVDAKVAPEFASLSEAVDALLGA